MIRYLSAYANLLSGQKLLELTLITYHGGSNVSHRFAPIFTGNIFARSRFVVAQDTQLYADPGTVVIITGERSDSNGTAGITVTLSGYLIDCAVGACS